MCYVTVCLKQVYHKNVKYVGWTIGSFLKKILNPKSDISLK